MTGVIPPKKTIDDENWEKVKIYLTYTLLGCFVGFLAAVFYPIEVGAQMFPSDAKTVFMEQATNGYKTVLEATTTRTILGADLDTSGTASTTQIWLYCGTVVESDEITEMFSSPSRKYVPMSRVCNNKNIIMKVAGIGTIGAGVTVTYVDRDITQETATSAGVVAAMGGFTYGDTITIFLLLMIFTLGLFSELRAAIFKKVVVAKVIKEYDRK